MKTHELPPPYQSLRLELAGVLPGVHDEQCCIDRLSAALLEQKGVSQAHVDAQAVLCLHYDPNQVSLSHLRHVAQEAGTAIASRYMHQMFKVSGMTQGTDIAFIERWITKIPGVFYAALNYAAERLKVEYDTQQTSSDAIMVSVRMLGYSVEVVGPGARPLESLEYQTQYDHSFSSSLSQSEVLKPHAETESGVSDHHHAPDPDQHQHGHDEDHHEQKNPKCDKHRSHGHEGHDHGHKDPNASWIMRNWELVLSLLCGCLGLVGFLVSRTSMPGSLALALYIAAYCAGSYDLARHTLPVVFRGKFDVEFLMLVAAVGAAALGEWAEGTLLLFLFSFGHALEHFAMDRARNAIEALGSVTPKTARIRRENRELEIPVEELKLKDLALVRPGERIAVDGKIARGSSMVDQSPITGESVPVEKAVGEEVFAGSINGDGSLEVEVTKLSSDTTMARVIQMVEEAQTQKSPTQTFTDKFEKVLVPAVLVVVLVAALLPPMLGWLSWKTSILRALSTLVGASPCALALATPAAVLAGIGQAARNGVLIKGGVHLENLGRLSAIALDKTGTITRGKPEVSDVLATKETTEQELLKIAASVETRSSHPLAQAVVRRAKSDNLELIPVGDLKNIQGRGVECQVGDELVRIGNFLFFKEAGIAVPSDLESQVQDLSKAGKPIMIVGMGQRVLGALALADEIRPETRQALEELRQIGISSLIMLTGDNHQVAQTIAQSAGLTEVRADLLPENKVTAIQELLKQHGMVAMVGDGVNDAPALAHATVGIAMGAGGTDVALETADVALMSDDLNKLPYAVALSRQSRRIIQQNLFISLGVIGLLVPSTLLGFANISLAVIFHEGSTLVVVFNALRLLTFKPQPKTTRK